MEAIGSGLCFIFALIYGGFIIGVATDRLFLRYEQKRESLSGQEQEKRTDSTPRSGSLFILLLVAIAITAALSMGAIRPELCIFALIYGGFMIGVVTDRLILRHEKKGNSRPEQKKEKRTASNPESGSVFTVLLAAVAMAAALSVVLYQTISGPMSSMVRVSNATTAKSQMQSIGTIVIMAAINQANNGECDIAGGNTNVVPPPMRAGTGPTGGGLIPLTIGAPVTDPWGTDYGYCAWEVGAPQTKCGGANLLTGTATPAASPAKASTVIAVISAGP